MIIPSYSRPSNLRHTVLWLLPLEPMQRQGSEIIITHGSAASYAAARHLVDGVRHLDYTTTNEDERWFVAQRYFAAAAAAHNNVLLHLDDDIVPGESMLQALIDAVALEPGFPLYVDHAPGLYGPSGLSRSCGKSGYTRGYEPLASEADRAVLTTLASCSKALNAKWLAVANRSFHPLLKRTRGNGEDLTYSFVAGRKHQRHLGRCTAGKLRDACATVAGEYYWVRGGEETPAGFTYHDAAGHYETRERICKCLYTMGSDGEQLVSCVGETVGALRDEL